MVAVMTMVLFVRREGSCPVGAGVLSGAIGPAWLTLWATGMAWLGWTGGT